MNAPEEQTMDEAMDLLAAQPAATVTTVLRDVLQAIDGRQAQDVVIETFNRACARRNRKAGDIKGLPLEAVSTQNCVLVALAAITGKQPNVILTEMLQWAGPDRQIMDIADGLMWRSAYTEYLAEHGWTGTWEPCAIPATALIILDGHAFAVVDGVLFDNGTQPRWNRRILAVYAPPSA